MRLSGCPSLSVKVLDDPLRDDPVAAIDESCVGCGNCGEVADAAVLCPSFYRADVIHNPNGLDDRARRACAPRSPAGCSGAARRSGWCSKLRHEEVGPLCLSSSGARSATRGPRNSSAAGLWILGSSPRVKPEGPPENDVGDGSALTRARAAAPRSDHQARHPRGRRAGGRRRHRLDRRARRAERLVRAVDLGAGRGAAHRRHDLLRRDGAARARARRSCR